MIMVRLWYSLVKEQYRKILIILGIIIPLLISINNYFLLYIILELYTYIIYLYIFNRKRITEIDYVYLILSILQSIFFLYIVLFIYKESNCFTIEYINGKLYHSLILLYLILKLPLFPFFLYIIPFYNKLNHNVLFFINSFNLPIYIFILSNCITIDIPSIFWYLIIATLLISSIYGLFYPNFNNLIGYSSIIYTSFMFLVFIYCSQYIIYFIIIYIISIFHVFILFRNYSKYFNLSENISIFSIFSFLSLLGFPPLPGFFFKFFLLFNISFNFIFLFILLSSLISSIFYLSFLFSHNHSFSTIHLNLHPTFNTLLSSLSFLLISFYFFNPFFFHLLFLA